MTDKKFTYNEYMKTVAEGPNLNPVGDLAKDIVKDEGFPKEVKSKKQLIEYLESKHVDGFVIAAANTSWDFFEAVSASRS